MRPSRIALREHGLMLVDGGHQAILVIDQDQL